MKKLMICGLILTMLCSLSACGSSENNEKDTKDSGKEKTQAVTENSGKSTKEDGTKNSGRETSETETEAPELPDNRILIRMKTGSETTEHNVNYVEGSNTVSTVKYTIDEYGLYTASESVRNNDVKKSKPGAFWERTEEGNTIIYRTNGLKPIRIVRDDAGTVIRVERGDNFETVFTLAEDGACEGAVYQSETKTEKTHFISYYDAEFREIRSYDFNSDKERTYTAEDYCEISDLLRNLHRTHMRLKEYNSKGENPQKDSCEIRYDEKGRLLSHSHTSFSGTEVFNDHFLSENDEVPKDDQEYAVLDSENRLTAVVRAKQGDRNYWTFSKTIYEDVPVVNDPLWIAYFMIYSLNTQ